MKLPFGQSSGINWKTFIVFRFIYCIILYNLIGFYAFFFLDVWFGLKRFGWLLFFSINITVRCCTIETEYLFRNLIQKQKWKKKMCFDSIKALSWNPRCAQKPHKHIGKIFIFASTHLNKSKSSKSKTFVLTQTFVISLDSFVVNR